MHLYSTIGLIFIIRCTQPIWNWIDRSISITQIYYIRWTSKSFASTIIHKSWFSLKGDKCWCGSLSLHPITCRPVDFVSFPFVHQLFVSHSFFLIQFIYVQCPALNKKCLTISFNVQITLCYLSHLHSQKVSGRNLWDDK